MDGEISKLIHFLIAEKDIYIKISELSLLKNEVIIKGDIVGLERITEDEKDLIEKIKEIEKQRINSVSIIANHLKIADEHITVANIIDGIDDSSFKQQLVRILSEFNKIISKQKEFNKINQSLLSKNLNYIKFMMNTIILGNDNLTYNNVGNDNNSKQKINIFDQRV